MTPSSGFQVVVLAGGRGVRMVSELPKVLHKVCGETLLARVLLPASALGPKKAVVVVGYQSELVSAELESLKKRGKIPSSIPAVSVLQSEQRGTGHAVMMAESELGSDEDSLILILPGDAPLLTESDLRFVLEEHKQSNTLLSIITAEVPDPAGFGRIIRDQSNRVVAVVEKKDCSPEQLLIQEINSSLYLVQLGLLRDALKSLTPNNAQGEYYLTDIVAFAVSKGLPVNGIKIPDYRRVLGANDRAELSALETLRRREISQDLMKNGVTLEDPERTYVDEGVVVGPDSYLGAGTRLRGNTRLGSQVVVDGDSLIIDSQIGDKVHIKLSSHLEGVRVGNESFVGPFARLRQGTVLHERVHVGNFLEAKNTEFHAEVKANHVSYLGDSSIGSRSNIGAGTICCNYDGEKKSKTTIEQGVFVGSTSTIVAPVTIETESYVAAGSVITESVPPKTLAIGRARQTNKTGWRKKNKE